NRPLSKVSRRQPRQLPCLFFIRVHYNHSINSDPRMFLHVRLVTSFAGLARIDGFMWASLHLEELTVHIEFTEWQILGCLEPFPDSALCVLDRSIAHVLRKSLAVPIVLCAAHLKEGIPAARVLRLMLANLVSEIIFVRSRSRMWNYLTAKTAVVTIQ